MKKNQYTIVKTHRQFLKIQIVAASFFAAMIFIMPAVQAASGTITGRVVAVHDGDTLTLLTDRQKRVKVRLEGIDAPEMSQAFGKNSKQSLSELVFGKTVKVLVSTTDDYDRKVGQIYIEKLWVNLEQVAKGMAWQYDRYSRDAKLRLAESHARAKRIGLWQDKNPSPPWDYRHGKVKK